MIITLCGSTRFKDEYLDIAQNLALDGHTVVSGNVFEHADEIALNAEQKIRFDNEQKQRISVSDAIFVINKDSYIGESTFSDIDWAQRLKKEIYFLVDITTKQEVNNESNNPISPNENESNT